MHSPGRILSPILRVAVAGTLALTATVATVVAAHAYPAPAGTASLASSCATVAEGSTCALTFTLLNSSNAPVSGATVTYGVTGVSGSTVSGTTTTNGSGISTSTFNAGSNSADCGKTATILGSSTGSQAQTTIAITCSSSGGGGLLSGLLGSIFTTIVNTLNLGNIVGILTGSAGGSNYTVTVPQGSLPAGTKVNLDCFGTSGLGSLTSLLSSGETLVDACDINWPSGVTASSPLTFLIKNSAIHPGDQVFEIVNNALSLYSDATVSQGVATILFSGDPAFVIVSPTTSTPSGLGDEGAGAAVISAGHPKGIAAGIIAVVLLLSVISAVVVVRRRRALAS